MVGPDTPPNVRLAEVAGVLALATDLATGRPLEHGLRRALLAVWLAQELGVDSQALRDVYYVALLGSAGCTLEAATVARYFSDEIALGTDLSSVDPTRMLDVAAFFLGRAGAGEPPLRRAGKVIAMALEGPERTAMVCREAAVQTGNMLQLGPAVCDALGQCHEQWSGKGRPRGLEGEEIGIAARIYVLAHDVEIVGREDGAQAATELAGRRAGKLYDPRIVARFCVVAEQLFKRLEARQTWDAMLAAEPAPVRMLTAHEAGRALEAMADFVDCRSSFTAGHSRAVGNLAEQVAHRLELSSAEARTLRWAGLVHDIGRAGAPVAVWDKSGALTRDELQRLKSHPALSELVLARSDSLGGLGALARLHHERLDGSGYLNVSAAFQPVGARILAVADAYRTKLEPRPHRQALPAGRAVALLQRDAHEGRLDSDVVAALAEVTAGQPPKPRRFESPAGLSEREVQVLRLLVAGQSNRRIAEALYLSPKTVSRHLERVYEKIGVSTRVGATLFALQHGLITPDS